MTYEVHLLGRWIPAQKTDCGYFVIVRRGSRASLGLMIPPGRMSERLEKGTARVAPDPEPPRPVACSQPYVARMLDLCAVPRIIIDPSGHPSEAA